MADDDATLVKNARREIVGVRVPGLTADLNSRVRVVEAPLNIRRYGAVVDGVTNDTTAIQNAINSLPGNASLGGGTILIDGPTVTGPLTINKAGVRFQGLGGYTSYLSPVAGMTSPMFTFAATSSVVRGWQMQDLAVDMLDRAAHFAEFQGAFDNCHLSNVWVRGINKAKSGFRFISAPGAVTAISQSIIADNVQAIRTSGATGVTAPLWLLDTVHEAHFRNCKAIGASSTDGGTGFQVNTSQLVKFDTCSASNNSVGWSIESPGSTDYSERVVLDTPLFEACTTGLKIVGTATQKVYRVKLLSPRVMTPITTLVDATYASLAHLETDNLPVLLKTGSTQCRVFSDDATQITDTSGDPSMLIVGNPNAAVYYYTVNGYLRVEANGTLVPATSASLQIGVNTTGSPALGTLQRVSLGAADSAGTGYRTLRVPN